MTTYRPVSYPLQDVLHHVFIHLYPHPLPLRVCRVKEMYLIIIIMCAMSANVQIEVSDDYPVGRVRVKDLFTQRTDLISQLHERCFIQRVSARDDDGVCEWFQTDGTLKDVL